MDSSYSPVPSDPYSFNPYTPQSNMPSYPVSYSNMPSTSGGSSMDTGYSTSLYAPTPGYQGNIYQGSIPQLPPYLMGPGQGGGFVPSVPDVSAGPGSGTPPGVANALTAANSTWGGNATTPGGGALPPPGGGGFPWSTIFNNDLGNRQLDQQQQWLNYQTSTWLPAQLQMQQDQAKIQNALAQAQATGDYQGAQTLQAQLQQVNENLANFQANQNSIAQNAGISGVMNGMPTMQAQQLMNQYAALGGNQNLSARGQDLGYDQALMNFATQQGQLQEQLATSPLVAWYTARGLPPPASAFTGLQGAGGSGIPSFMDLYRNIPQFQGLGQYKAPQYNWQFSPSLPPQTMLPTNLTAGSGTASNVTAP